MDHFGMKHQEKNIKRSEPGWFWECLILPQRLYAKADASIHANAAHWAIYALFYLGQGYVSEYNVLLLPDLLKGDTTVLATQNFAVDLTADCQLCIFFALEDSWENMA